MRSLANTANVNSFHVDAVISKGDLLKLLKLRKKKQKLDFSPQTFLTV